MKSAKPVVYYLKGHVSGLQDDSFDSISWGVTFVGLTDAEIQKRKILDAPLILPVVVTGREDTDGEWLTLAKTWRDHTKTVKILYGETEYTVPSVSVMPVYLKIKDDFFGKLNPFEGDSLGIAAINRLCGERVKNGQLYICSSGDGPKNLYVTLGLLCEAIGRPIAIKSMPVGWSKERPYPEEGLIVKGLSVYLLRTRQDKFFTPTNLQKAGYKGGAVFKNVSLERLLAVEKVEVPVLVPIWPSMKLDEVKTIADRLYKKVGGDSDVIFAYVVSIPRAIHDVTTAVVDHKRRATVTRYYMPSINTPEAKATWADTLARSLRSRFSTGPLFLLEWGLDKSYIDAVCNSPSSASSDNDKFPIKARTVKEADELVFQSGSLVVLLPETVELKKNVEVADIAAYMSEYYTNESRMVLLVYLVNVPSVIKLLPGFAMISMVGDDLDTVDVSKLESRLVKK